MELYLYFPSAPPLESYRATFTLLDSVKLYLESLRVSISLSNKIALCLLTIILKTYWYGNVHFNITTRLFLHFFHSEFNICIPRDNLINLLQGYLCLIKTSLSTSYFFQRDNFLRSIKTFIFLILPYSRIRKSVSGYLIAGALSASHCTYR